MRQKSSPSRRIEKPSKTSTQSSSKTAYWNHYFSMWSMCREAHAGADFLAETVLHGKDPHWSSSWRTASCGRNLMLEQGKGVRRKEQQRESIINWLQLHFLSSLAAWSGGGRIVRSESETGKKQEERWEGRGRMFFVSHCLTVLQIAVNKLNFFPWV